MSNPFKRDNTNVNESVMYHDIDSNLDVAIEPNMFAIGQRVVTRQGLGVIRWVSDPNRNAHKEDFYEVEFDDGRTAIYLASSLIADPTPTPE